MTLEETIAHTVESQVAPLTTELRRLTAELEALRRALPVRLVSLAEAAQQLGVSLATVRRRVRDGSIPSRKLGRAVRVDLSALVSTTATDVATRVLDIRTTLANRRERTNGET